MFGLSRDPTSYAAGRALFAQHCAGCHGIKVTETGDWHATTIPVDRIGTNPNEARDFAERRYDARAPGLGAQIDGAAALQSVTQAVQQKAYAAWPPDGKPLSPARIADAEGFGRPDEVRVLAVYKARPLVGVWAGPPYLHNGSVPTIYDLLSETRPATFPVGSRFCDPARLGLDVAAGGAGTQTFDTRRPGDANAGHRFTDEEDRPGRLGPALSDIAKRAILEYLRFVTYADYPCHDAATRAPRDRAACGR